MRKNYIYILTTASLFLLFSKRNIVDIDYSQAFKPRYVYTSSSVDKVDENILNSGISLYDYQWYIKNKGKALALVYMSKGIETVSGILGGDNKYNIGTYLVDSKYGFDINLEKAWGVYDNIQEKRKVVVAVIDTGIDIYHEDLNTGIWINKNEVINGLDDDNNAYVDDINGWNFIDNNNLVYTGEKEAHGTHEAGIIAATWNGFGISGIADSEQVKIMPLKILDGNSGRGNGKAIKNAILYAKEKGANIVNLSLTSSDYDSELYNIMKDSNMLFVIASGNGEVGKGFDIDAKKVYPAAFDLDNVISVANMNIDGNLEESSNYGKSSVDIAAPGNFILSTLPNNKYGIKSGTSMAAAVVSGVAALTYSARPDMDIKYLKEAILNGGIKDEKLKDKILTSSYIDAFNTITYKR